MSIKYNKNFLSLVNDLSLINNSIIVEKKEDNVHISCANPATTIFYMLDGKTENFEFSDDKIAFYDYSEFYQILNVLDKANISIEENKVTISNEKSKIKYIISDPETIKKGPSQIKFPSSDVKMILEAAEIKNLKKMISLLNSKFVRFTTNEDKTIKFNCFNDSHDNSYERDFATETTGEKISMKISSEIFTLIPDNSYCFEICKDGLVRFTLSKDDITLSIYVAEIED